jgi:hypothetical protein
MEVTGSKEGTEKIPKFSLLKNFMETDGSHQLSISRAWLDTSFIAVDLSVNEPGRESSSISNRWRLLEAKRDLSSNGGDDFVREKKALHFGIRKHCVPYYDSEDADEPSEVEMIQSIDCEGGGLDVGGVRYGKPQVSELDMAKFLSEQELEVLCDNLGKDIDTLHSNE